MKKIVVERYVDGDGYRYYFFNGHKESVVSPTYMGLSELFDRFSTSWLAVSTRKPKAGTRHLLATQYDRPYGSLEFTDLAVKTPGGRRVTVLTFCGAGLRTYLKRHLGVKKFRRFYIYKEAQ